MIIGILSDTHGHLARCKQTCELLLAGQSKAIIHCGDIGSESILIELAGTFDPVGIPVHAVLGNVDVYQDELIHFPDTTCVQVSRHADFHLADKRIAVIHGDDQRTLELAVMSGIYDYVFTGHTHVRSDHTTGHTRVINPGAVYRAAKPGCATLDTHSGTLTYFDL